MTKTNVALAIPKPRTVSLRERPYPKIILKNGDELLGAVDEPKGEPGNPITEDEVRETFHRLAAYAVDSDRARKIEQVIDGLDTMDNISELTSLL